MKCVCISCFDAYETRFKYVINYLVARGDEVKYLVGDFDHYLKQYRVDGREDTHYIHVKSYKKNLSVARLVSHSKFAKKALKEVKRYKPDLIYCMFPPNSLVKRMAQYKSHHNVKLIFDCYDMWPESFPYKSKLLRFPFMKWRNLRDKYIEEADLVICVSYFAQNVLKEKFHDLRSEILFPYVEVGKAIKYNSDISNKIIFCYLGNINHITDIQLGIALLTALQQKKQVELHIIGAGNNLEQFVKPLTECGVSVITHGVIYDMSEKKQIYSLCNFALNIPRKEIQSSMSLKSIEYIGVGLPIINSGVGDTSEIIEKYGIGINISQDESSVDCILALTADQLADMHLACGKAYHETFSFNNLQTILGE